ncbi:pantetheine-phosphate adenylyltransferase [Occultella glacieicola]|uniref:pantetheine-phosphate adenylyltransferase n=1 Tax=Occultella glacieicola TaxID=2518684 RepID=UPI002E262D37|nr:pantetheine-phosphate adenylyltransferase [Occultella glacieicola]
MTSRIAVCPGSYDPVTLGHLDIVRRALTLFDEVVVVIGINAAKSTLLTPHQRRDLFTDAVADLPGARVLAAPGLIVDVCRDVGASAIVKGLRGGADFDAEQPMTLMNRYLAGVETVYLSSEATLAHISSSMVKEVARYGGDITDLVPPGVADAVYTALGTAPGLGPSARRTESKDDPR